VRIIGFGTYDRDKHPRVGILLDGLRQLGDDVSECNEPLGFSTAQRVAMLGKPWLAYRLILRLVRRWYSLTTRRIRLGRSPDVVVVGYLGHFDVILARLLFPRTVIALDLLIFAGDTAIDRGVRKGPKLALLGLLDRIAVSCASLVILDTEEHALLLPERQRGKAVIAPVGSPDEWFAPPSELPAADGLRVLFFGLFTPLQGAPVVGEAVAALSQELSITVTMVGSGQDRDETRRRAGDDQRIIWHDWVEPAELRALARNHHVCLGIFAASPKAIRVTPNKVFQGAAAGCAVLTSDTPPQRRSLGDAGLFVPVADPPALAEALRFLATEPNEVRRLRAAAYRRAEQEFRPESVARPLRDALIRSTRKRDL
jgi:glycosyltransferase involved in cell wall biosynthesis